MIFFSKIQTLQSVKEKQGKMSGFSSHPWRFTKVSSQVLSHLPTQPTKKVQNVVGLSWSYAYNMHVNRYIIVYVKYIYISYFYTIYLNIHEKKTPKKKHTENDSMLGSAIFNIVR